MRYLTEEEIERIHDLKDSACLGLAAVNRRCGFRKNRLIEACKGRVKFSEEEISLIYSNLATAQPIQADQGQRMLCTSCKKNLTAPGQRKCAVCRCKPDGVFIGDARITVDGKPLVTKQEREIAERLAGMVTPVMEMVATLRKDVFERFEQAENASKANADFAESIHERLERLEQIKPEPRLSANELASRIEHCMQELSRQGKRIEIFRNELDTRISALAQLAAPKISATDMPGTGGDDLLKSFAGFEKICRQMRAKCPHLFAATVRRACGVV